MFALLSLVLYLGAALTPCTKERTTGTMKATPGAFVVQCDANGAYEPRQCWGSTGACWCVNPEGKEIEGTHIGSTLRSCKELRLRQTAPIKSCAEAATEAQVNSGGFYGVYVPQCTSAGAYKPRQCWGSTGSCWCVDQTGEKIEEMYVGPEVTCPGLLPAGGSISPVNPGSAPAPAANSDCLQKNKEGLDQQDAGYVGQFIPSCNPDGSYASMQCWGSTGQCWCADSMGNEIFGSKTNPGQDLPECSEFHEAKEVEYEDVVVLPQIVKPGTIESCPDKVTRMASSGLIGAYIPQCNTDGSYSSMQCWGSTGTCWCVDAHGHEIMGTKSTAGSGEDSPKCGTQGGHVKPVEIELDSCRESREEISEEAAIGTYIPQCKQDGTWQETQCWGSTGQCWCVNRMTGAKLGPKTGVGAGQQGLNCASPLLQRAHVEDTKSTSSSFGQKEAFSLGVCVASLVLVGIYLITNRNEKTMNDYQEYLDVENVNMDTCH